MSVDTALASELRTTVMRLARRLRNQRSDTSLSLTQLATLGTLDRHGPLTPGELAAHERVQPPSMTRVVSALEAAGLVTRTDHPTDGRQVLIAVSPAGKGLLRDDRMRRDAWLAQRLRDLDPADLATLRQAAAVLDKLAGS
ncbi:MAG: transcriptional regulator, MarR family [Frankiales bacterium]|jgi:DNA-binding MarR family transcriptional regulator|nr:transcriptional regulator, MarR family [Frankiales bacterium]